MNGLHLQRHDIALLPESSRVIIRPFIPASAQRIATIIGRALALSEEEAVTELQTLHSEFDSRHFDIERSLLEHYARVSCHVFTQRHRPISRNGWPRASASITSPRSFR